MSVAVILLELKALCTALPPMFFYMHVNSHISSCNTFQVKAGLPLNIHFKFPDFSLTFNRFPDPFGRPILAIFIHLLLEDYAQILEFADLIFKEKS